MNEQPAAPAGSAPVPVEFKITTYYKLKRGQFGPTSMTSKRLVLGRALDWVLGEFPDEAVIISNHDPDLTTVTIDWSKVPPEIRYGARGRP